MKTKPRHCVAAVATERGWVDPVTKELLVSVRNLKSKLKIETRLLKKESKMETQDQEPREKRQYNRKPKVIGEVTETPVPTGMRLIGEVVEYNLDTED